MKSGKITKSLGNGVILKKDIIGKVPLNILSGKRKNYCSLL